MVLRVLALALLSLPLIQGCGGAEDWGLGGASPTPTVFDDDDSVFPDDDDAGDDDVAPDDDDAGDDDDVAPDDDDVVSDDDDASSNDFEGDAPGECDDGADNDQDGLFDCDDPDCFGAPDCQGDDDDAAPDDDDVAPDDDDVAPDDDDVAPDDDDVAPDDDDSTPPPGAPVITNVTYVWNGSTSEFEFSIYFSDGDCDLGLPDIHWLVDGVEQAPASLPSGSTPFTCTGQVNFNIGGLTAGYSYTFGFYIADTAGNFSAIYTVPATAS